MNKLPKKFRVSSKRGINALKLKFPHISKLNNQRFIVIKNTRKPNIFLKKWIFLGFSLLAFGGYYIRYHTSIPPSVSSVTEDYVYSTLTSGELKEGGVSLLDGLLRNKHTQDALMVLVQHILNDKRIIEESKNFGNDILTNIIQDKEITGNVKNLLLDVIKAPQIKAETVGILDYIIDQDESKDIIAQYFKVVFLREDIIKSLSSLVSEAVIYSLNSAVTKKKFTEFVTDIWSDPHLRWSVLKKSVNFWTPETKIK